MFRIIKENKLIRTIILFLLNCISFINEFLPKNKKQILLYDSLNNTLTDNTLGLLLYLKEKKLDEKYKIVCCVPNSKEEYIYGIKNKNIFSGIFAYLTSKYVFYSFGGMRINPSKKQIVVNLWHGIPLKKVGKLNSNDKTLQNEQINDFTYVLVPTEFFREIYKNAFGCNDEQLLISEQPRNYFLFKKNNVINKLGIKKENFNKVILWMPTFRLSKDGRFKDTDNKTETMLPLLDTIDKINEFDNFLAEHNILVVLKVHGYSVVPDFECKNIIVVTNEMLAAADIFLYEFIKDFDALITDYSSVYFDYLLLERPIGFIVDDFNEYKNKRGFTVEDPLSIMPGEHITNIDELKKFILSVIANTDKYFSIRKRTIKIIGINKTIKLNTLMKKINIT